MPLSDGCSSYISVPDPSPFACHIFLTVYVGSLFGWFATPAVKLVQTRARYLSYTKVSPSFPVIARGAQAPSLCSIFLFSWRLLLFFFLPSLCSFSARSPGACVPLTQHPLSGLRPLDSFLSHCASVTTVLSSKVNVLQGLFCPKEQLVSLG